MSLPDITRWLTADWTHVVAALGVLALGYALAWAAIRASYERVVGRPMPRTRLVLVLDILADLAVNVPGALNRLLRSTGRDPLFLPAALPSKDTAADSEALPSKELDTAAPTLPSKEADRPKISDLEAIVHRLLRADEGLKRVREQRHTDAGKDDPILEQAEHVQQFALDGALQALRDLQKGGDS
jgi:hypothetical protein